MKHKFNFNKKYILVSFYFGCIVFLTLLINKLSALPFKYEMLLLSPFYLLFILFVALLLRLKSKWGQYITQIACGLLSIVLIAGSVYVIKGQNTLDMISGANKKTYTMSLLVPSDSDLNDISSLSGKNIELITKSDLENQNQAMEALKNVNGDIRFNIVETYQTLVEDLYSSKADALLINEAYRSMLEVEDEDFNEKTKIIWSYEITEDAIDVRKEVNVVNTPFTVYISGIDTTGPISTVSRTDVNMLVTVNPNTKEILLTSIPRDAWVELANMQAYDKLTHSGIAGVENSIATIENFMGIEINYYARVNFTSLVTVVDALGGISIYNENETANGYQAGYITLDGEEALSYARNRHGYDYMFSDSEQGDQMRVENQQTVLEGIIQRMISPAILNNFSSVLSAVEGTFETNMSTDEITDLIEMQLEDMADWKFVNMKVTGTYEYQYGGAYMPDWNLVYYITNPSSVSQCKEAIDSVLNNKKIS